MLRNYYEILDISRPLSNTSLDSAAVKRAYRKALLRYHPDKAVAGKELNITTVSTSKNDVPTIDEITLAYKTLSDVKTRSEYDRQLQAPQETGRLHRGVGDGNVGLEIIDLDDMSYDEARALWTRECRCGIPEGFVLSEDDLEKAIEGFGGGNSHELLVGCLGCSLCLKVNFAVAEEA